MILDDNCGNVIYYKGDCIHHRSDGPAVYLRDGRWSWMLDGRWHRYYGPQSSDGEWWYIHMRKIK